MKDIRDALIRIAMFALVFVSWMWVLVHPFSEAANLTIIIGGVLLVFPVVLLGRLLLDADPDPEDAAWLTTLMHALLMVLFGAALIRAIGTYESWSGWVIPVPLALGLALVLFTGTLAGLAVVTLAARGAGAPFGIALSRRLAVDWMYGWTRNPMVLATLAFLVALGLWLQSAYFVLWALLLVSPALLFYVKFFEERELEIRFGEPYRQYRARTPMLIPRRPHPPVVSPAKSKPAAKPKSRKQTARKSTRKRKSK
jgi:protein-S-isoprenylcysteine O-methyltransferase Ste14